MPGRRPVIPAGVADALRHLAPDLTRSIRAAIRTIGADPSVGEPLQRELEGLRKFRVRRYRVIYRVVGPGGTVRIVAVGQRRSIYEALAELMRQEQ